MQPDIGLILTAVFAFVTALLAVIPTLMIMSRRSKLRRYIYETEAEVIDIRRERFGGGAPDYRDPHLWVPTFRYYAGGQEIIHHSRVGTSENIYSIGQRVPVRADPYDPRKFLLVNSRAHRIAVSVLYAISGSFLVITVAAAVILKKFG